MEDSDEQFPKEYVGEWWCGQGDYDRIGTWQSTAYSGSSSLPALGILPEMFSDCVDTSLWVHKVLRVVYNLACAARLTKTTIGMPGVAVNDGSRENLPQARE